MKKLTALLMSAILLLGLLSGCGKTEEKPKGDTATITLSMEVKNAAEIKLVMNKLNSIRDVLEVSRSSGKVK